jgi:hypothetical protein
MRAGPLRLSSIRGQKAWGRCTALLHVPLPFRLQLVSLLAEERGGLRAGVFHYLVYDRRLAYRFRAPHWPAVLRRTMSRVNALGRPSRILATENTEDISPFSADFLQES